MTALRWALTPVAAVAGLTVMLAAVTVPTAAAQVTALEIVVRDSVSDQPVADAQVVLTTGQSASTDATGHALLLEVHTGRHRVIVRRVGYIARAADLTFTEGMTTQGLGSRPCEPPIFLDGVRYRSHGLGIDRLLSTRDVEAVEVYAGYASTPLQFQTLERCGAVVIWTRRG